MVETGINFSTTVDFRTAKSSVIWLPAVWKKKKLDKLSSLVITDVSFMSADPVTGETEFMIVQ